MISKEKGKKYVLKQREKGSCSSDDSTYQLSVNNNWWDLNGDTFMNPNVIK